MALTQAMCTSFKRQLLVGMHNFRPVASGGDTFKIALYSSSATYNANTTAYSATNEITGTNYTAGGNSLTGNNVSSTDTSTTAGTGFCNFSTTTWAASTITARGAVIYNSTGLGRGVSSTDNDWLSGANATSTNAAVCVLDFGADKVSADGDFTINFPAFDATTAIIRIA
jgi:hypothetical protein